jgi:hypothetical protein
MEQHVITMKMRLEYLYGVFKDQSGIELSFPEFMECLFTKLENETRESTSGIEKYYKEGEGNRIPINRDPLSKFIYDYEK